MCLVCIIHRQKRSARAGTQGHSLTAERDADAANGLQRWRIAYMAGTNGIYSVTLPCGHAACNQYLSCGADCGNTGSDLYYQDDGSGRQQWQVRNHEKKGGKKEHHLEKQNKWLLGADNWAQVSTGSGLYHQNGSRQQQVMTEGRYPETPLSE